MNSHPRLLALSVLAAVLLSGAARPRGAEDCLRGPFLGITETDPVGNVIGRPDAKDWGCLDGGVLQPMDVIPPAPPPTRFCLRPAFPNPLAGATRLELTVPRQSQVILEIWQRTKGHGQPEVTRVRTLLDHTLVSGVHAVIWDGTDDLGVRLPPGIYRVVMLVDEQAVCGDIELR